MKLSRSLLDAALFASLGVTSPIGADAVERNLRAANAVKADETSRAARRALNDAQLTPHENAYCNPGECRLREGTYEDPWGNAYEWWAYVPDPQGPYACPDEGCPLFIGISGTGQDFFHPADAQWWMFEMMKRGFVGVTVGYANSNNDMGLCYGQSSMINVPRIPDSPYGVVQKAQHIFDPDKEGSVIQQVCDGPEAVANCDLGIAAAGVSQGSFIVGQGSNFERRISALLLWATGDDMQIIRDFVGGGGCARLGSCYLDWSCPCMDNIQLPAVRRRMINGAEDLFFGRDAAGTLDQYKRMTGGYYDCGDSLDCLTRAPETVVDKYTGGSIANEGGYHIVEGGHTNGWLRCLCDGQVCAPEEESTCVDPAPYFDNTLATNIEQGPASFDWLSRTARITYSPPTAVQEEVTLDIDLNHWRLFNSHTGEGFYLEWADANGVFGQRKRIGEGVSHVTYTSVAVPEDTPGFRISAATKDAAFIDQLEASASGNFQGMQFGQNRGEGWCLSLNPSDTFYSLCIGGEAHSCIDFCADGTYHFCDLNNASSCLNDKDATKETAAAAVE